MIDLLVLNYNDSKTTISFVESVINFSCIHKVLVVDNCSTDDSFERLKKISNKKIVVIKTKKNGGYGAGNNFGIRYLYDNFKSKYILLCNPDVVVSEKVCNELESFLNSNVDYAIVAPFMLNSKGEKMDNTAFRIPQKWEYILSLSVIAKKCIGSIDCGNLLQKRDEGFVDVGGVSGSLFLMNAQKMIKYGMFDESIFLYCEEIVLSKKMQNASQKIALLVNCCFIHNHSVSISKTYKSLLDRRRLLLTSKLYVIKNYFNANIFEMCFSRVLAKISLLEIVLIELYRFFKGKK